MDWRIPNRKFTLANRRKRRAWVLLAFWSSAVMAGTVHPCCKTMTEGVVSAHDIVADARAEVSAAHAMPCHRNMVASTESADVNTRAVNELDPADPRCQGMEAFHNTPVVASAMLNVVDDDNQSSPAFSFLVADLFYRGGLTIPSVDGCFSSVRTPALPVYLSTLRLRI